MYCYQIYYFDMQVTLLDVEISKAIGLWVSTSIRMRREGKKRGGGVNSPSVSRGSISSFSAF